MDHAQDVARSPAGGVRPRRTRLAALLLSLLAVTELAGQPTGLFEAVGMAPAASVRIGPTLPEDRLALRRRLVSINLKQIMPPAAALPADGATAPSGVLTLNLFDDAVFTGLVERVAPTFSGGQSLSGRLAEVKMGTMMLVVNGTVVAGTVRTPEATYRIRPAGNGLHVVSQVDPSQLPLLDEPIPRQRLGDDGPSFELDPSRPRVPR